MGPVACALILLVHRTVEAWSHTPRSATAVPSSIGTARLATHCSVICLRCLPPPRRDHGIGTRTRSTRTAAGSPYMLYRAVGAVVARKVRVVRPLLWAHDTLLPPSQLASCAASATIPCVNRCESAAAVRAQLRWERSARQCLSGHRSSSGCEKQEVCVQSRGMR